MQNHQQRNDTPHVKKNECKPWLKKMWCIGEITQEYRTRMYDLLKLYAKPYNSLYPLVCLDEKSKQLLAHTRRVLRVKKGSANKEDYEYKRNGTRNIFLAIAPKAGKRFLHVTKHRAKRDFAVFMSYLTDRCFPQAKKIHVVCDNLNTHFESSFYESFTKNKAKRIFSRIQFHYTPKHASWLNMAEIELSILERQCLKKRMKDERMLIRETAAWKKRRNQAKATINWTFTRQDADEKLGKHYV